MHIKRADMEKFWPIPKKGTKYLAVPSHNNSESLPLIVVLRDVLKIVRNSKELQRALHEKKILVNHKNVHEVNYPVSIFDIISIPDMKKNYKAKLSLKKKMEFEEVKDKESLLKIFKILNKKSLDKGRTQINLMHGRNIISQEKIETGDSVLLNLKDNKIVKVLKLEKGNNAFVIKGKHAGSSGKIEEIVERGGKKIAKISSDKKRLNVWTKNIIITE